MASVASAPVTRRSLLQRLGLGAAGVAMVATLPAEVLRVDGREVVPELDPTGRMIPVTPENVVTTAARGSSLGDLLGKNLVGWNVVNLSTYCDRGAPTRMSIELISASQPDYSHVVDVMGWGAVEEQVARTSGYDRVRSGAGVYDIAKSDDDDPDEDEDWDDDDNWDDDES